MSSEASIRFTSSPGLAAGPTRSNLPDGPDLVGPGAHHASPSPPSESNTASMTQDISGRRGDALSRSAALQSSLESNLRKRLIGSPLCEVIWSKWTTPWGQSLWRPRASARPTIAIGSGLWPTPTANRWSGLQSHGRNLILGPMNPAWIAWLMGFPPAWISCAPSETPSSRKPQRPSSKPTSRPDDLFG